MPSFTLALGPKQEKHLVGVARRVYLWHVPLHLPFLVGGFRLTRRYDCFMQTHDWPLITCAGLCLFRKLNMASTQLPNWDPWLATPPTLLAKSSTEDVGIFTSPPSPRPTVHDEHDGDETDFEDVDPDGEAYGETDTEAERGRDEKTASVHPKLNEARAVAGVGGPLKFPTQGPSRDMRAEIRKMIKEECTIFLNPS